MRVEGREVAARARGDPATERRMLETLWEMPQCQAARLQLSFELGPPRATLDARGAAYLVNLKNPVHALHVDSDGAGEAIADVTGHPSDD